MIGGSVIISEHYIAQPIVRLIPVQWPCLPDTNDSVHETQNNVCNVNHSSTFLSIEQVLDI